MSLARGTVFWLECFNAHTTIISDLIISFCFPGILTISPFLKNKRFFSKNDKGILFFKLQLLEPTFWLIS